MKLILLIFLGTATAVAVGCLLWLLYDAVRSI